MASIRTGIELTDRFTPVIHNVVRATTLAIDAMQNMNATMREQVGTEAYESIAKDLNEATVAAMQLENVIGQIDVAEPARQQASFNQSLQEGGTHANRLMSTIKSMAAAYISLRSVGSVLNLSDEVTQTTARLNLMNDGVKSTEDLFTDVYYAAQDARGSITDMASVIARFGNNAKDAFGSTNEVVQFATLVQKQMAIAGASTQESSAAMLQLSQALGSGVLRGEELNSIFEQAPNIIQSIADYLNVPIGKIRQMASEGQLSADIVKSAIFASADDINARFEQMPMTWNQVWQSMKNTAIMNFQPVLKKINEIANSERFQSFVQIATQAMAIVANAILYVFDLIGELGGVIADNWSWLGPIIYGVIAALAVYATYLGIVKAIEIGCIAVKGAMAVGEFLLVAALAARTGMTISATAAQLGLNGAMYACPIVWIIILIIALIAIIAALISYITSLSDKTNSSFGRICGVINVVIVLFKNLGLVVANIFLGIGMAVNAVASNIMAAFHNAISTTQSNFYALLATALAVIAKICAELNKLPFVNIDYSGIVSAADNYAAKSAAAANNKKSYTSVSDAYYDGINTFDVFENGWANKAYNTGANFGNQVSDKVKNVVKTPQIPKISDYENALANNNHLANTAKNTGNTANSAAKMADALDITSEDIKYLRDIAERDVVNRFTTAEIKVEMINNNTVTSDRDLDGISEYLRVKIEDEMNAAAEGVY